MNENDRMMRLQQEQLYQAIQDAENRGDQSEVERLAGYANQTIAEFGFFFGWIINIAVFGMLSFFLLLFFMIPDAAGKEADVFVSGMVAFLYWCFRKMYY